MTQGRIQRGCKQRRDVYHLPSRIVRAPPMLPHERMGLEDTTFNKPPTKGSRVWIRLNFILLRASSRSCEQGDNSSRSLTARKSRWLVFNLKSVFKNINDFSQLSQINRSNQSFLRSIDRATRVEEKREARQIPIITTLTETHSSMTQSDNVPISTSPSLLFFYPVFLKEASYVTNRTLSKSAQYFSSQSQSNTNK